MMAPMETLTLDRYHGVPLGAEAFVNPPLVVELKRGGQTFTIARPGLALVEALSDACLSFN